MKLLLFVTCALLVLSPVVAATNVEERFFFVDRLTEVLLETGKATHNVGRRSVNVSSDNEDLEFMSALRSLQQDNVTRQVLSAFGKALLQPVLSRIGKQTINQLAQNFASGAIPEPVTFLQAFLNRTVHEMNLTRLDLSPETKRNLSRPEIQTILSGMFNELRKMNLGKTSSNISSALADVVSLMRPLIGLRESIEDNISQPTRNVIIRISELLLTDDSLETLPNAITRIARMLSMQMGAAGLSNNGTSSCYSQTMDTLSGLLSAKPWAMRMLDAWGKPRTGILGGQISFPGSYDQCRSIHVTANISNDERLDGRYCRLDIMAPSALAGVAAALTVAGEPQPLTMTWGLCVPETCTAQDINSTVGAALMSMGIPWVTTVCSQEEDFSSDRRAVITLGVLLGIAAIVLLASIADGLFLSGSKKAVKEKQDKHRASNRDVKSYTNSSFEQETDVQDVKVKMHDDDEDVTVGDPNSNDADSVQRGKEKVKTTTREESLRPNTKSKEKPVFHKVVQAISIYTNLPKLLSAKHSSGSITCLGGLRVLSMCWVVLGHVYVFIPASSPTITENGWDMFMTRVTKTDFNMILSAHFAVDTFFFLSGLLVSFLFYTQMFKVKKNRGKAFALSLPYYYIHRYVRLTPLYLVLMMISAYLYRYMGNGPYWNYPRNLGMAEICQTKWWTNVLYINNFIKVEEMCMAWGWYLANDMQFYVIAPIFLGLTLFIPVAGIIVTSLVVAGSVVSVGVILSLNTTVRMMAGIGEEDFEPIYIKPWCRFAVYGIGLFVGFILAKYDKKIRIHKGLAVLGWLVCSGLALTIVFAEQTQKCKGCKQWSREGQIAYSTLHRPLWGIVLAWIVIACHTGVGGVFNNVLSWRGFLPLGRLTYGAYLLHEIIISIFAHSRRENVYFDPWNETLLFCGFIVITFGVAAVFSLLFEAPIMQLEKILMSRLRKRKTP